MTSSLTAPPRPADRAPGPAPVAPRRPHRRDIQGLRAVAVLLVVLAHAGVPWLAGGYVGVDVFFVISGFLITTLLVREHAAAGRISLARFYARRAVRLLPAATVVSTVTLVASWLWMPPARVAGLGWDALASAGYAVNVRLAAVATDYFANPAPSPFQHFWSLAVEEQFYLAWPLLLLLVLRVRRRVLRAVLAVLSVASFAYSVHQVAHDAPWAYFGLPSRAWELGVGALLALAAPRIAGLPRRIAVPLGWLGLAAIVAAAGAFRDTTPFPGVAALAPVLGAGAVIAAGTARGGAVGLLGRPPLQAVGALSYGWYLWHWPILVIAPAVAGHDLGPATRLGLGAAALGLAGVTYRWVENPVRYRRALTARPIRGLALGLGLSATAAAFAAVAIVWPPAVPTGAAAVDTRAALGAGGDLQGQLSRLITAADGVRRVPANLAPPLAAATRELVRPQTDGCHLTLVSPVKQPPCVYGPANATRTVVVIGDSHALQWFPAFDALAERFGWRLVSLTRSSCSPAAVGIRLAKFNRRYVECDPFRQWALSRIHQLHPDLVVVASSTNYPGMLADRPADPERVWSDAWVRLFDTLRADARQVVLLADTPVLSRDPLDCLSTYGTAIQRCAEPVGTVLRNPAWRADVRDAARRAGVTVVDPTPWLCAQRCPLVVGNLLVYRDTNHLTSAYAQSLAPLLGRGLPRLP